MDEFVFERIDKYYQALGKLGYMSDKKVWSLLLLAFYYHLIYNDYRCAVNKKDYHLIERAMNCLYGSNCLIPYPDYLKMGKLKLGEMTELMARLNTANEGYDILHEIVTKQGEDIEENTSRIDGHDVRLDTIEGTKVIKGKSHIKNIADIDLSRV